MYHKEFMIHYLLYQLAFDAQQIKSKLNGLKQQPFIVAQNFVSWPFVLGLSRMVLVFSVGSLMRLWATARFLGAGCAKMAHLCLL